MNAPARLFDPAMPPRIRESRERTMLKSLQEAIQYCDDRALSDLLKGLTYYVACMHTDADRMETNAERITGGADLISNELLEGAAHIRCPSAAAERNATEH